MLPISYEIEQKLANMSAVIRFSKAGSIRRMRETIKDLDFIISTDEPEIVKEQLLALPGIKRVIAAGDTKVSVVLEFAYDISVDFRIVKLSNLLQHFIILQDQRIIMFVCDKSRKNVEKKLVNMVLKMSKQVKYVPSKRKNNFTDFDLPFIPPEVREDGTEVEQ